MKRGFDARWVAYLGVRPTFNATFNLRITSQSPTPASNEQQVMLRIAGVLPRSVIST